MSEATIHNWIYVIIPIENRKLNSGRSNEEHPLFAAYCKQCRTYFTEVLEISAGGKGHLSNSSLPRYGCNPISEDVTMLG